MYKRILLIDTFPQFSGPGDEFVCGVLFQSGKIWLHIHDRIKIATIRYIHHQFAQLRAIYSNAFCGQISGNIGEFDGRHFFTFLPVGDLDQSGRRFHQHHTGRFGLDQSFFNGNGDGADGSMPAHGQTATGFNEQYRHIMGRIMGWIKNTATHHIMTAGFKHESFADPVVLTQKMLAFFAHGIAFERRTARGHYPDGVAAGMRIDTGKNSAAQMALHSGGIRNRMG